MPLVRWSLLRRPSSSARKPGRRGRVAARAGEVLEERTLLTAYVVDSLADTVAADGRVTLREAVLAANRNAAVGDAAAGQGGGAVDSITFDGALSGGTILLSGAGLTIDGDLTVSGLGADRLAVSGGGALRVFAVAAGSTVAIGGLTVTGGWVEASAGPLGAGVLNRGVLTLTGVAVSGSTAVSNPGVFTSLGGGVYNEGALGLVDSVVSGNSAAYGAGVYNAGTGTLNWIRSRVTDNVANNLGGEVLGGGLYNAGVATLTGGEVSRNTAVVPSSNGLGGGISAAGGSLALRDVTVAGNSASSSGGGLFVNSTTVRIDGCTFRDNVATLIGGGIANSIGIVLMSNSTLSGNSVGAAGGGYSSFQGSATFRNVTVFGNRADADGPPSGPFWGGGIYAGGPLLLHNTLVTGNVSGMGAGTPDDAFGPFDPASSYNLIGILSNGGISSGVNGNQIGVDWSTVIDPVLRDNGGPTATHRLLPMGPAVDAGSDAQALGTDGQPLLYDQRGPGHPRIQQTAVDIGAYEAAPADDLIGFFDGTWYVGTGYGNGFGTTEWAQWADAAWDALKTGDFDGDGKADVLGLLDGEWYVGLSNGGSFVTGFWGRWANVAWEDVLVADVNGDGRDDVVAESAGAWYGAVSTGAAFAAPALWAMTADIDWDFATLADLTGEGWADLALLIDGDWCVLTSTGSWFGTARLWGRWRDADYSVRVGDVNADGLADLIGLTGGEWVLAGSTGARFNTVVRAEWRDAAWVDPVVGDFDGDGRDDVAARLAGEWWVGLSNPDGYEASRSRWASWAEVAWEDVRVGDFDGDGRDDLAGRYAGEWYVARSTGAAFATALWERWAEVDWTVLTGDATGSPAEAPAAVAIVEDEAPLAAFWAQADEDEAFAGLLAAV